MSNQLVITSGAKVRSLNGVITGTTGVLSSLPINSANGIPQLDSNGKILVSQLPNSVMEYQGTWNASTNTPTLTNGTGNQGDVYLCNVAGTTNFGAGPISFFVGDQVIYSGTIWQRASGATGTVTSVGVTKSGNALSITGSPITTSGTINIGFAGTTGEYIAGNGTLITFPSLTGFVPYTGATSDVNLGLKNLYVNNVFDGFSSVVASGTQIVLTLASVPSYLITGSGGQTIKLPDATTLPNGAVYIFNNNQSSGAISVNNNSNTLVVSIPSGGYCVLELTDNSIAAGSWDRHFQAPSNVSWSTNTLDYAGSITSATWNGNVVAINRGGTGASTAGTALSNLGGVPTTRTLSINGTTYDLSADRSWTITAGVSSVTATSPLFSSGGANPNLTIQVANTSQNGYLSSTDWTTFNNKQNALGYVPIGGSGSINYISKFTGSTTISQSGIYEGSAGKISINNTNTTYALDVTGVANFSNAIYASSFITNSAAGILIGTDISGNGGSLLFTQNTSTSVGGPGQSSISTSSTNIFRLQAGISSGVYKEFQFDNSLLTNNTVRTYQVPDASGTLALTSQLSGVIYGSGVTYQVAWFNATNSIGSSGNLYFDPTNNRLGINNSSPSYSLDVTGTSRFTENLLINSPSSGVALTLGRASGKPNIKANADAGGIIVIDSYDASGQVYLQTYNSGNILLALGGGNVGIGTGSPSYRLQLSADSAAKPTSALWTIASDIRIKENINPYKKGLEQLLKINPITYDYNGLGGYAKGKGGVGIIAQEIIEVLPDSVSFIKGKLNEIDEEETDILNFNGHELIYVLINSIKELELRLKTLENK